MQMFQIALFQQVSRRLEVVERGLELLIGIEYVGHFMV